MRSTEAWADATTDLESVISLVELEYMRRKFQGAHLCDDPEPPQVIGMRAGHVLKDCLGLDVHVEHVEN